MLNEFFISKIKTLLGRRWGEDRGGGRIAWGGRSPVTCWHLVLFRLWCEAPLGQQRSGRGLRVLKSGEADLGTTHLDETHCKRRNGPENRVLRQSKRSFLLFYSSLSSDHTSMCKILPKAQRTRGLSSSCQNNFLRSYHKFKHKSWSHFIFRISTKHQLKLSTRHQHLH